MTHLAKAPASIHRGALSIHRGRCRSTADGCGFGAPAPAQIDPALLSQLSRYREALGVFAELAPQDGVARFYVDELHKRLAGDGAVMLDATVQADRGSVRNRARS